MNNPNFTIGPSTESFQNNCTELSPSCRNSCAESVDDRYTTIKNMNADYTNAALSLGRFMLVIEYLCQHKPCCCKQRDTVKPV